MNSLIAIACMVKNEEETIDHTLSPFVEYGFKNIV